MDPSSGDLELGDLTRSGVAVCQRRHKCRSCERTRSIRIRILSWFLEKFSLVLLIVLTSAATNFVYHKILPEELKSNTSGAAAHSATTTSVHTTMDHTGSDIGRKDGSEGHRDQLARLSAARLLLEFRGLEKGPHLYMVNKGENFYVSGSRLTVSDGALQILQPANFFISADVILNSVNSQSTTTAERGPTTVVVCLTLVAERRPKNTISCSTTYLRERDQQLARVWTLLKAEANDRIYVNVSWPKFVISDNKDSQQSVFTAFEIGSADKQHV